VNVKVLGHKLFRFDDSGRCLDCGLFDNHGNACHDAAPGRLVEQLLGRMNDLYSYLSLVRHRHLPRNTDDRLIRDIDQALGAGSESLKEWWAQKQIENQRQASAQKGT